MKQPTANPIMTILAMLAILVTAAGLDESIRLLRELNARTAMYIPLTMISMSLANLLLAAMLLGLLAWATLRPPPSRWLGWTFLLVGLAISLFPLLFITPLVELLRLPMLSILPMRLFYLAAAGVTVTGAVALIREHLLRNRKE